MMTHVWIATAFGLVGGLLLAYGLGVVFLPPWLAKSEHMHLRVRLAFAGTVVAFVPALLLSLVVGGTLGEAWGERVFDRLGFPSGAPLGLALGVAVVLALVLVVGAAGGILLANVLVRYRSSRR